MTTPDQAKPSILLVDDDEVFRNRLARAFDDRGYEVRVGQDYDTAMASARDDSPEFAVVDLKMPGKGGLELVKALHEVDPQTKIVVLTGYGSIATAIDAVRLGATYYLSKPADADDIVNAFARGQAPLFLAAGASGSIQGAQWGLSFSYDVTCMNADGDEITCGADTDSAHVVASWSGSWDGTWLDADTAWEADWELTGLQGDTWVLNGSSSVDWSASWDNPHNGAHREWSVQASAAADDLTFAASARRPVGGTASYYLQIDRVGEGPNGEAQGNLTVDADVTFSDSGATLVLDGSRDYSLNVTTGDTSAQ